VKLLIVCPIPVEFNACREVLSLRDIQGSWACRAGRRSSGNVEVYALESGPAKVRAAWATTAGIQQLSPQLVLDTGCCAGIRPGSAVGEIILAKTCYEYDISGGGFPKKSIREMRLPSALQILEAASRQTLLRRAVEEGRQAGYEVRVGDQACGEFLIQSQAMRQALFALFGAEAGNWETAGVFIPALKSALPALSLRVVTDLGDENALRDFRRNAKEKSRQLYRCLQVLIETGWFALFMSGWEKLPEASRRKLPSLVRP